MGMEGSAGLPTHLVGNPSLAPSHHTASPPSVPMPSSHLVGEVALLAVAGDSVVGRIDTVGPLQPMQRVSFVHPPPRGVLGFLGGFACRGRNIGGIFACGF